MNKKEKQANEISLIKKASITLNNYKFVNKEEQLKFEQTTLIPAITECWNYLKENIPEYPNMFITLFTSLLRRIIAGNKEGNTEWSFLKSMYDQNTILKDTKYFEEFTKIMQKLLPIYQDSLNINEITATLKYVNKSTNHRDKSYYNWCHASKKLCISFTDALHIPLGFFYEEDLNELESIILEDITMNIKRLPTDNTLPDIAEDILKYAKTWIHQPDRNFQKTIDVLVKLRSYQGAKELLDSEKEFIKKMTSSGYDNIMGYNEKRERH